MSHKTNMEEKDLEVLVLKGLAYESFEKKIAAERKALTRKNGIKKEDAKYTHHSATGQVRDIVGEKIKVSGRQWEHMKFIYEHKDWILEQEYYAWRTGKISTSKLYKEMCEDLKYTGSIEKMINTISQIQMELIGFENSYVFVDVRRNIQSALYGCREKTKEDILTNFNRITDYHQKMNNKQYNEISEIKTELEELKQKLRNKTNNYIE